MLGKFETVRTLADIENLERRIFDVARVQIDQELRDDEYRMLSGILERNSAVTLRAFGFSEELASLRFLQWFPRLKRFSLSGLHKVASLENLSLLPSDLTSLDVGETAAKFDLTPATRFRQLQQLRVVGHLKGLDSVLESARGLRALSLWRLPLDRVSQVGHLSESLESLALTMGSSKDPEWLLDLTGLRYVAVRAVRGMDEVDWVARLSSLEFLWLDGLTKLVRLPDLGTSRSLKRLDLTGLRGLRQSDSLEPIVQIPAIEELLVTESPLPPQAFTVLKQKTSLRRVGVGLGSARRNAEALALLKLERPLSLDAFAEERGLIAVL